MKYYEIEGIIYREDGIEIEPNDSNPLWQEYVNYLENNGTLYKDNI